MERPALAVSNGRASALPQGFSPRFPLRPSGDYAYRFDDLGRLPGGDVAVAPCRSLIFDELERIKMYVLVWIVGASVSGVAPAS
jgi:hypothetical protein